MRKEARRQVWSFLVLASALVGIAGFPGWLEAG